MAVSHRRGHHAAVLMLHYGASRLEQWLCDVTVIKLQVEQRGAFDSFHVCYVEKDVFALMGAICYDAVQLKVNLCKIQWCCEGLANLSKLFNFTIKKLINVLEIWFVSVLLWQFMYSCIYARRHPVLDLWPDVGLFIGKNLIIWYLSLNRGHNTIYQNILQYCKQGYTLWYIFFL